MDKLEEKLAKMRLTAPSDRLEDRMEETFRAARNVGRGTRKLELWWWLAATATAGGVAAVLLLTTLRPQQIRPKPEIYRIEAQGRLREMLLKAATNQVEPTDFEVRENER